MQHKCRKPKRVYDQCYTKWYGNSFTVGKLEIPRDYCDDLFEEYRSCIFLNMKEDRDKRGLNDVAKDSALGEFIEEIDDEEE